MSEEAKGAAQPDPAGQALVWANAIRKLLPLLGKDCNTLDDLEAFLRGLAASGHSTERPLGAVQRPVGDGQDAFDAWRQS